MEPLLALTLSALALLLGARFGQDSRRDEKNWPAGLCAGCSTPAHYNGSEWLPRE